MPDRQLLWFSAGAASAVAAKLVLAEKHDNVVVAYVDTGAEHEDNKRFIAECEEWFGSTIVMLKSDKYLDTWDVWEKTRFLVSPQGARCTTELKKKVRRTFEQPGDVQTFGYTVEEQHRADRFREQNPEINLRTPLIEHGLNKQDCLSMISRAGIEIPTMYKLGYSNNDCIGCPKGGMGYWNKIRVDFPDTFQRMAELERTLNVSVLRSGGKGLFLDELDPNRGNHATEASFECSMFCQLAEENIKETDVKG
jgi:hypothetical protein